MGNTTARPHEEWDLNEARQLPTKCYHWMLNIQVEKFKGKLKNV
jgi:hypothetical protein